MIPVLTIVLSKVLEENQDDMFDEYDEQEEEQPDIIQQTAQEGEFENYPKEFEEEKIKEKNQYDIEPERQNIVEKEEQEKIYKQKDGSVTGAASEINEKKYQEKDIPLMTKSAEMQESIAKNNPIANNYPEQEYYKISLNLDEVRKTGEIPEWMKEHNDIRTLDKVRNKDLAQNIREKIIKEAKTNNDIETVNNPDTVFVITVKPSSILTNLIINDQKFNAELENKLQDIKNGKYENSSFTYVFESSFGSKEFSTGYTIGKCDIHDAKLEKDGYINATIIDYYDFSKGGIWFNNNANIQQQNKRLENYALVIPIRIKIKTRH